MTATPHRAYLVDDELLAIERLTRLLEEFPGIEIVGSSTDPVQALNFLGKELVDVLFLDIQMPGMNGFELLSRLPKQPFVIFTTAYDRYALKAFETNSIDYLLKPVEPDQLYRALGKLDRLLPATPHWLQNPEMRKILNELAISVRHPQADYSRRIASRVGERITFVEVDSVTHFQAEDKLTYAVVNGRRHSIDETIVELERKLDPARFLRIHRAVLLNLDWVREVNSWFAGKVIVSLKDDQQTKLPVARDRVRLLKTRMGF